MSNDATPAPPGDINPRHVFLTAKEVILRYGWGRTDGYRMLKSTGFPRRIGDRFRLDTLMLPPSSLRAATRREAADGPPMSNCARSPCRRSWGTAKPTPSSAS
jgi:hypothetical protein